MDLIVNLADESITGVEQTVWVENWPEDYSPDSDLDNEDVVLYASHHGHDVAALIEFARKIADFTTGEEGIADLPDPEDPDQVLEAEQDYKHYCPDTMDALIAEARELIGRNR
jgi:hypothetical protein